MYPVKQQSTWTWWTSYKQMLAFSHCMSLIVTCMSLFPVFSGRLKTGMGVLLIIVPPNHSGGKGKYHLVSSYSAQGVVPDSSHRSVHFSHSATSNSLQPHELQHTRLPCPSPNPKAYSNTSPSSLWCHPTISSSVVPFSSYLQSFPASGSFPMSQFFTSGGQSIGVSPSASVSASNEYSGLISFRVDWISLQSKGLSRIFSNTTVQKHQFFSAQLSL